MAGLAGERQEQIREGRLPEFTKLALEFDEKSFNLVDAENWVVRVEKAFSAFKEPDKLKMPMVEFQLKIDANDW